MLKTAHLLIDLDEKLGYIPLDHILHEQRISINETVPFCREISAFLMSQIIEIQDKNSHQWLLLSLINRFKIDSNERKIYLQWNTELTPEFARALLIKEINK